MEFIPVIGLEVHAQLLTQTKAFCRCPTEYGAAPNSSTCPICLGMPGVLPVLNRHMVDLALRLALALNCSIRSLSQFARKNYFYPDLPKGYQISQFNKPLAEQGFICFDYQEREVRIGIRRVHLEEDAGKSFHLDAGHSWVDLNRCGVPLVEIVSEPDLTSPEEARTYLNELKRLLQHLDVCSGDMEKGALRCDANVSVRHPETEQLGIPTEVKNLNSFRSVQRALEYEIQRQSAVLRAGGKIERQTLLWDEGAGEARPMRRKELAHDYRYFPEPDLALVAVSDSWVAEVKSQLPEVPRDQEKRLIQEYSLKKAQARTLGEDRALVRFFEETAAASSNPILTANFIIGEVLHHLKETGLGISDFKISPDQLAGLIIAVDRGQVSQTLAKEIFVEMLTTGEEAEAIIRKRSLSLVGDEQKLAEMIQQVIRDHPAEVKRYLEGTVKLFGFFMGQTMQLTRGQGDPVKLRVLLEGALQKLKEEEK